jgi:hypothetical protein
VEIEPLTSTHARTMSEAEKTVAGQFKEINLTDKQIQRFWSKVDIAGDDECWFWTGCTHDSYGVFSRIKTHRIAWTLSNGPIPTGMLVCHSCDNPPCCNPKHLWSGTQEDNEADKISKGRHYMFAARHLTVDTVREIRSLYATKSSKWVAAKFGLDHKTVREIWSRKLWSWLDVEFDPNKIVRLPSLAYPERKLTDKQVIEAVRMRKAGCGIMDISRKYGVDHKTIGQIIRRETYKHVVIPADDWQPSFLEMA